MMAALERLLVFDSIRKSLAAVILSLICFIFSKVQMPVNDIILPILEVPK